MDSSRFEIQFDFENEGEIFQLQQLVTLIRLGRIPCPITLHMPFLPYGRQDKRVSNSTTFALSTFAKTINGMSFHKVTTIDAHSDAARDLFINFTNIYPEQAIRTAHHSVSSFETDAYETTIAYPDAGARKRYDVGHYHIVGNKVRNQETGYIEKYEIEGSPQGRTILMVDDICDGGMTFKLMAEELLKQGADSVHLYVTHGIFSKGLETLRASGIERIFTKDGEVK